MNWDLFVKSFVTNEGYKEVLQGLGATVLIAVCGLLIGILIGTVIAVTKVVPQDRAAAKVFSRTSDIYVGFFRGTPIIVQLLLIYFVLLPAMGLNFDKLFVAVLVFGMNSGAYVSEIMRSGIQSVNKGQMEAGRSLGLSYAQTMLKIILPQAVKNILPTIGNEFISLVKETSVVSFIAVVDLTKAFKTMADSNYQYVINYLILAAVYLVLVMLITWLIRAIERRMKRSER